MGVEPSVPTTKINCLLIYCYSMAAVLRVLRWTESPWLHNANKLLTIFEKNCVRQTRAFCAACMLCRAGKTPPACLGSGGKGFDPFFQLYLSRRGEREELNVCPKIVRTL